LDVANCALTKMCSMEMCAIRHAAQHVTQLARRNAVRVRRAAACAARQHAPAKAANGPVLPDGESSSSTKS
jgi:hypothetical protein